MLVTDWPLLLLAHATVVRLCCPLLMCLLLYLQLLAVELSCLAFFTLVSVRFIVRLLWVSSAMHMEVSLCALITLSTCFVLC